MKKSDLLKKLLEMGCEFVRHGGKHDFYRQPKTGKSQPVPRHREIKEILAKKIILHLNPDKPE